MIDSYSNNLYQYYRMILINQGTLVSKGLSMKISNQAMKLFWMSIVVISMMSMYTQFEVYAKRPKRKKYAPISSVMKTLKWGIGHQAVFAYLDRGIKAKYDRLITQAGDDLKVDSLRKEQRAESKLLRANFVKFSGQKTGYEVSVVQNDFAHNNSETMLKVDEGTRQRYYFFRYDRLWKVMVIYSTSIVDGGFKSFVKKIKQKYGNPKKKNWSTPYGGSRRLVEAVWSDQQTQMVLEDKSAFYDRYVMRLVSVADGEEIQQVHKARQEQKQKAKQASQQAKHNQLDGIDIFAPDPEEDDIVDQITGKKHKVELNDLKEVPDD